MDGRIEALFDAAFYMETNADLLLSPAEAFSHYMTTGWLERRDPSRQFCTAFYLDTNPDVAASGTNPFGHWVLMGDAEGRPGTGGDKSQAVLILKALHPELSAAQALSIALAFDEAFYLRSNADVARSSMHPVLHYFTYGWREKRDPCTAFSTSLYLELNHPDGTDGNPFIAWVLTRAAPIAAPDVPSDEKRRFEPDGYAFSPKEISELEQHFDREYYKSQYLDRESGNTDPFDHFMMGGWKRLNNPSRDFSVRFYLQIYDDIRKAGVNPLVHWVQFGQREGRRGLNFSAGLARLSLDHSVSAICLYRPDATDVAQVVSDICRQTMTVAEIIFVGAVTSHCERDVAAVSADAAVDVKACTVTDTISLAALKLGCLSASSAIVWFYDESMSFDANYLRSLAPHFKDPSVMLAFGSLPNRRTAADDRSANRPFYDEGDIAKPAAAWFAANLDLIRDHPVALGTLWRNAVLPERSWEEVSEGRCSNVWILYRHMVRGGQIAHDPSAKMEPRSEPPAPVYDRRVLADLETAVIDITRHWSVPAATIRTFYENTMELAREGRGRDDARDVARSFDFFRMNAQQRSAPHILVCIWDLTPGGAELFPIMLANALVKSGLFVSLLVFETSRINKDMRAMVDRSIPVYDAAWVDEYGADRFLAEAGISVIHSHTVGCEARFCKVWNCQARIPYLATLHGSYESSDLDADFIDHAKGQIDYIVYTADKNLLPFGPDAFAGRKTKMANAMPIDPRAFPKSRADMGIAEDAIVFCLVARGVASKGWQATISAFKQLEENAGGSRVHLLLCGDGEETQRTFALHGDDPAITYLGFQSCIHGLYRLSDVCLVPSRFSGESYPLCIIQALQCGTPIVATRIGEIESMIAPKDGTAAGLLVEYSDDDDVFTEALRTSMEVMLCNEEREAFSRAALEMSGAYDIDILAGRHRDLYVSLMLEKSGPDGRMALQPFSGKAKEQVAVTMP